MDRKEMVKTLSEILNFPAKYLGAPRFAYEIKTQDEIYTIDRQGNIITSEGKKVTLDEIIKSIQPKEEKDTDSINLELPIENHNGRSLKNVLNMLYSKQHLIVKALELKESFIEEAFIKNLNLKKIETLDEFKDAITELGVDGLKGIYFYFDKGTFTLKLLGENITNEKIKAFMKLSSLINSNAQQLKYASYKQSQEDNPKYAFRTWLIRLGMNGDEYKEIRKTLLSNLDGNSAFRKISKEGSVE
ncbi:MAG: virulence-related protein [Caloramator sp.]|nr:virulence-related protein [Caloramator sp.]